MSISYQLAHTLDNVLEAWRLVYDAYQQRNLILPDACRIHTVPQAVEGDSVVMLARTPDAMLHATLSAYHDGPHGLPLDSVYGDELDALRSAGRQLVEIGLFADRRDTRLGVGRTVQSLLELMRWTTWFAVYGGATDAVVGVHPRHADFYRRVLGFESIGPTRSYSLVNGAPVTLLRLDWYSRVQELTGGSDPRKTRGLHWIAANPVAAEEFTHCNRLRRQCAGSALLQRYLRRRAQPQYLEPAMQAHAA